MKIQLLTIIGILLAFGPSPASAATKQKPAAAKTKQQPVKKQQPALVGHSHSSSSSSSHVPQPAYASAYNSETQTIAADQSFHAIFLPTDTVYASRIIHPVADSSQFMIRKSGVYLITWDMTLLAPAESTTTVTLKLVNVATGSSTYPSTVQTQFLVGGDEEVVAGQAMLELTEGTILQLLMNSDTSSVNVLIPSMSITSIVRS